MRTIGVGILTNPTMAKWWPNFVHIFQHHGAYGGVSETSMKLIDSNSVMFKHVFSNFHRPMGTVFFGRILSYWTTYCQTMPKPWMRNSRDSTSVPLGTKINSFTETSDQTLKFWRTLDDLCDFKRTSVTNSWGSINKHEVLFEQERKWYGHGCDLEIKFSPVGPLPHAWGFPKHSVPNVLRS